MRRSPVIFVIILVWLISHLSFTYAEIIETNGITTIESYASNDSLVLFNVTGTLYEPAHTLADNRWRIYFTERVNALEPNKARADHLINKVKNAIVNHLPKKPVEKVTPLLIANLQSRQIPILGITQKQMVAPYADNFGAITSNHLLSIGINLENTLSYLSIKNADHTSSYSFAFGLIFTNKKPVGPAVLEFLDRLYCKPKKIIVVDNSRGNLENIEAALLTTDIEFRGFRYGHSDTLKTNFDLTLGHIQFFTFMNERQTMTDDEAKEIKQTLPEINYNLLLDEFIVELLHNSK